MIAVDTNLLIYAHREEYAFHREAQAAIRELALSGARWAIPWPCVHEFLAVATNPRIHKPPTEQAQALEMIANLDAVPSCEFIGAGIGYLAILNDLVVKSRVAGGMVHDARIAAICIHHGVSELWSADRDFSRFPRLKTRNPLTPK